MRLTSVGVLQLVIWASTFWTALGQTCPASPQTVYMCETSTVSSQNITLDISRGANSSFSNCSCVLSTNVSGFSVMFNSYPPPTNCTSKLTVFFEDKSIQVRCGAPATPQTTSGASATIVYTADYNVTTADSSYCITFFGGTNESQLTLTCDKPSLQTATASTPQASTISNITVTTSRNNTVSAAVTTVRYSDSFTTSSSSGVSNVTTSVTSHTSAINLNATSNLTTTSLESSYTTTPPSSASLTSPISLSTISSLTTSTMATTTSAINDNSTLSSLTAYDTPTTSVSVTPRNASVTTAMNPPLTTSTQSPSTDIPTTEMHFTNATDAAPKTTLTVSTGTTDYGTTASDTSTFSGTTMRSTSTNKSTISPTTLRNTQTTTSTISTTTMRNTSTETDTISTTTMSNTTTIPTNLSTNGTSAPAVETTTTVTEVTSSLETKTSTKAVTVIYNTTTLTSPNTTQSRNTNRTTSRGTTNTPVPTVSTTKVQNTTLNSTDVSTNYTTTDIVGTTITKIMTTTSSVSLSTINVTSLTTNASTKQGTTGTVAVNNYTRTTSGTETTTENTGVTTTPLTTFSTTPLTTDTTRAVPESIDNTTDVASPENFTTTGAFNETSTDDPLNGTSAGNNNTTEINTIKTTKSLDYGNYDSFDYEPESSNAAMIIIPLVSILLLGVIGTFTVIVCKRLQRVKFEARRKSKEDAEKADVRKDTNFKLQTGFLASSVQTNLETQGKSIADNKDRYTEEKDASPKQDKGKLSVTIEPIHEDNIETNNKSADSTLKDTMNGGTLGKTREYEPTQRERELLENLELSSIVLESDPDDPNRYFKKSDPGDWYRVIMKKKQPKGLDTLTNTDSSLNGTASSKKSIKHRKRHKDSTEGKSEEVKRRKSKDRLDDVYNEMTSSFKDSKSKRDKHGKSRSKLDEVDGSKVPPDSLQPRIIISKPIPTAETSAKLHEKVSRGKHAQTGDIKESSQSTNETDTSNKPTNKTIVSNSASTAIASHVKSKQPIKPVTRPDIVPPLNLKGT